MRMRVAGNIEKLAGNWRACGTSADDRGAGEVRGRGDRDHAERMPAALEAGNRPALAKCQHHGERKKTEKNSRQRRGTRSHGANAGEGRLRETSLLRASSHASLPGTLIRLASAGKNPSKSQPVSSVPSGLDCEGCFGRRRGAACGERRRVFSLAVPSILQALLALAFARWLGAGQRSLPPGGGVVAHEKALTPLAGSWKHGSRAPAGRGWDLLADGESLLARGRRISPSRGKVVLFPQPGMSPTRFRICRCLCFARASAVRESSRALPPSRPHASVRVTHVA